MVDRLPLAVFFDRNASKYDCVVTYVTFDSHVRAYFRLNS